MFLCALCTCVHIMYGYLKMFMYYIRDDRDVLFCTYTIKMNINGNYLWKGFCCSWIYFTWPLRKQAAYKQATGRPMALSPFWGTRQYNEEKGALPKGPGWDSNWGPRVWTSVVLFTWPRQLLGRNQNINFENVSPSLYNIIHCTSGIIDH